jgi:alkanesulfonate monooxygenase SsuD/methylene tetrahydromethanopterin reductase-like flavin-dependent oxidoreductase (luciferase family)
MGLGAGWNEPEHRAYGIEFPAVRERFDRLEEALQVITKLWEPGAAHFAGQHYRLDGAEAMPKPANGRIPVLIGGSGEKRTLRLVAKYADEWHADNLTPDVYRQKVGVLERHCDEVGRDPATIRRSMMTFGMIGPTPRDVDAATERLMGMFGARPGTSPAEFREGAKARGLIVGGTDDVLDTLGKLGELGLQEVQFQHFNFDSDAVPEYLAGDVAPRAKAL